LECRTANSKHHAMAVWDFCLASDALTTAAVSRLSLLIRLTSLLT